VTKAKTPNGFVIRRLGSALIVIFIVLLTACGGGGQALDPATQGSTSAMSISSKETGLTYDVDIWLPPGYAQSTVTYPVIYAMDCEYRFTTLSQVLQETAAKLILVNVCAMGSARRWVDFTMPGAVSYYQFLIRELIPLIEARWRTDTGNRTLSGHSLSGEFALYALYLEDPADRKFTSFISEECSCWYDSTMFFSRQLPQPLAMEQAMYQASKKLPVNLVMADDTQSNETNVAAVYATIASRNYEGLRSAQPVYSLGHVPMDGPAFRDALGFIFNIH
jgi:predicted alpha/beta superfamily hydrolase